MDRAQDPENAAIYKQFEEACSDFQVKKKKRERNIMPIFLVSNIDRLQVPATRAAAEQIMTQFRQIPKVLPACQYILGKKKKEKTY